MSQVVKPGKPSISQQWDRLVVVSRVGTLSQAVFAKVRFLENNEIHWLTR